jgi:hypothetical protein
VTNLLGYFNINQEKSRLLATPKNMDNLLTYLQSHSYQLILQVPLYILLFFDSKLDTNFTLFGKRSWKHEDLNRQVSYLLSFLSLIICTVIIYNIFENIKEPETNFYFWVCFAFLVIHSALIMLWVVLSIKQNPHDKNL